MGQLITLEHFIYGYFPGVGYKLIKSPGVDKLLTNSMLNLLCHLGNGTKKEIRIQVWLRNENLVSISLIKPVTDEYGRSCVWNHTILVPIQAFLDRTHPAWIEPYFIRELNGPSDRLNTLTVK